MRTTNRTLRRYDHRLREIVYNTQDISYAVQRGVPRSTARGWLKARDVKVWAEDVVGCVTSQQQREVLQLRRRIQKLTALLRVLLVVVRIFGLSLNKARLPDGSDKHMLLRVIQQSRASFPLRAMLRVLRLSPSRFHKWNSTKQCSLNDRSSCPRSSPHQLTALEVNAIRELATSEQFRHVPTGRLAWLAQRLGKVFVSASTWYRLMRDHQWRRPRQRVHPAAPKIGIRASRPNEIWHIDTSLLRSLDGSRVYLHAVIDNFSRRILAWKVADVFTSSSTVEILEAASNGSRHTETMLLADCGSENVNSSVDALVQAKLFKRVLAQAEILFSNSLIESWWRSLKHQWLFLNKLDSVCSIEKLTEFYVHEHNSRMPHAAFQGQTPDEMYFGTGGNVPAELLAARQLARQARIKANRNQNCSGCELVAESLS